MATVIKSSKGWDRERPDPASLDPVRNSWWDNVWANRGLLKKSTRSVSDLFQETGKDPNGRTVVVCAAGYSLFDHRDELVDAVKRFKWDVVTVDKTRLFLVENGIIPTLTVSADADPIVAQWMVKIAPQEKLAFSFQSHPAAIKAARKAGAEIYMYSNGLKDGYNVLLMENDGERFCCMMISCNVGTAAIWCALRMNYSNIILLGFDYGWKTKSITDPMFQRGAVYDKSAKWWTVSAFSGSLDAMKSMSAIVAETNILTASKGSCSGFEEKPRRELIHKGIRRVTNAGGTRMKDGFTKMTFAEAVDLFGIFKD